MRETRSTRKLTPGAIALAGAPDEDLLLPVIAVALSEDQTVTVVPVSAEVHYASDWDLFLDPSVLGYPAIAEVWNYGSVLPEQCREIVTALAPDDLAALQGMLSAAVHGQPMPSGAAVGAPVLADEDPRLLFQDAEAEAVRTFWAPTLKLAGASTLGEVVRHNGVEADTADAVADLSGASVWLKPLQDDELDLARGIPATVLAELLRRLGLRGSARLRAIVWTTLEASSPAIARGAHGEAAPVDREAYLDAVFTKLEGHG